LVWLTSIPTRKWAKEFLEEVKKEAIKDEDYQRGWEAVVQELSPKAEKARDRNVEITGGVLY